MPTCPNLLVMMYTKEVPVVTEMIFTIVSRLRKRRFEIQTQDAVIGLLWRTPRVLRGFEVPVVVERLEDGRLAALLVQPDVEVQHVSPGHL